MNLVSDRDGPPPPETPEQLRARLLGCKRVRGALTKVAAGQGVPAHWREDVVQETLLRFSRQEMPSSEEDAVRRYINGIGRNVAVDLMRERKEDATRSLEAMDGTNAAPTVGAGLERRAYLQGLFEQGRARFGKSWDWFLASRFGGETSREISEQHAVTDGHVRKEISVVDRWFTAAYGARGGAGLLAVLLAVGAGWWLAHRTVPLPDGGSGWHEERANVVQTLDAPALRERARRRCQEGAWLACAHDLEDARRIDPAGETDELRVMEWTANQRLLRFDPVEDAPVEMNAKPK